LWLVEQAGDYATPLFHHFRDATPTSELSLWFQERVKRDGGRGRRTTIVALARKLLVALWKFVSSGVVIEGAAMKAA
jgi:transposase